MATMERWRAAQTYEQGYWEGVSQEMRGGNDTRMDFYQWRADQLRDRLLRLGYLDLAAGEGRALEVGGGPIGLLNSLPGRDRVSVDSLEDFYSSHSELTAIRDPGVRRLAGVGEDLPAEDEHFDLVIIENCIDHVRDMDVVMRELRRVLRPGGLLYLTVNARTLWGYFVHRGLSRLRLDPGHPHTVTRRSARRLMEKHGFTLKLVEEASFLSSWRQDLRGPAAMTRLKGVLGVSEFMVSLYGAKT